MAPFYVDGLLFFPRRRRRRHLLSVLAFPLQTIKDGKLRESSLMETFHAINLYLTVAIGWRAVRPREAAPLPDNSRERRFCVLVPSEPFADISLHQVKGHSGRTSMTRWAASGTKPMPCASVSGAVGGKCTRQYRPDWWNPHLFLSRWAHELLALIIFAAVWKMPSHPRGGSAH